MREGARKWKGPRVGLVFMRLRRKRSYFIFWRTRPPEMVISSARTTTCKMHRARYTHDKPPSHTDVGQKQSQARAVAAAPLSPAAMRATQAPKK